MKIKLEIPKEIQEVVEKIQAAGFEAYLVGGCVRDMLMNIQPKDWDMTTNAKPEEIQKIFEHTFYENDFGTVGVVLDEVVEKRKVLEEKLKEKIEVIVSDKNVSRETIEILKNLKKSYEVLEDGLEDEIQDVSRETILDILNLKREILKLYSFEKIEITPYRLEQGYSDGRHPDEIKFSEKIEDDLKRRDFTVNALAFDPLTFEIIDLFDGLADLNKKIIRTVGNPDDRFGEDGLRIMRAIRFSAQLDFQIEEKTFESLKKNISLLGKISMERIRDEFVKILMSNNPEKAINVSRETGVLKYFLPELCETIDVIQGGSHIYDVYTHLVKALQYSAEKKYPFELRLAALLHDIGKPKTAQWSDKKQGNTFFSHEFVGAKITKKILERLKFSNEIVTHVTNLVRNHMFFADPDKITLSAVRRVIRKVGGVEEVWNLIRLRIADRMGMGRPKAKTYRLRKFEAMIEEASRSPISVRDLKINGDILIADFGLKPGRKIGDILNALMFFTLDNPENNNYDFLEKKVNEFLKMSDEELQELAKKGRETVEIKESDEIKKINKKYFVK